MTEMKMKAEMRTATIADAQELAPRLRQADINELTAATGEQPITALSKAIGISRESYLGLIDGRAVCLFGIAESGVIWMVSSDYLTRVSKTFIRTARRILAKWLLTEPLLWNVVDERNTLHIKWLKWMGFNFTGRHIYLRDPTVKFLEFQQCASPHS